MAAPAPTTTSYVVLGLLSLRSWSAYELAQQSERSLRWVMPQSERAVYLEVKRLVRLEWAVAHRESTGRRARTVYTITDAGRSALHDWLGQPSASTKISAEVLLRLFLADEAPAGALQATLKEARVRAEAHLVGLGALAAGPSRFPERLPTNALCLRLLTDINLALRDWAIWAQEALSVVEAGDEEVMAEQTRRTLAYIQDAGARVASDASAAV